MDRLLKNSLVTPQSTLIEKTALELAAVFYEAGRSSGLKSKHQNARDFAKANVKTFIPKAVELLMDMLGSPACPQEQKDIIYDCIMERTNDPELSNSGIPVFQNNTPFLADAPVIYDKPTLDSVLLQGGADIKRGKFNG